MTAFASDELTQDAFLGGRLRLGQPCHGYRAGVDPVLLAACVPASPGQSVLELGCGAGAAVLCLAARVSGLRAVGVELQPAYAELARDNAARNQIELTVETGDLTDLPATLRQMRFHQVLANPPYFRSNAHSPARDRGRRVALAESDTALEDWFDVAARRLLPKGYLHMIQRADRLPEMLAACEGRLGAVEILPLAARNRRSPHLVILRARKGGRAAFRLHAPLILHAGDSHDGDRESYTADINDVLRHGQAIEWPST
ncbi:methyltransferase [Rhodobacteraceae bacterium F11138]|nr:methyltransferase [Rhodobacteraceae bacterium F11138]